MAEPIVIIGAGLAGWQVAREFRRNNSETAITIITADDGHFYTKPHLSVAFAQNKNADTLISIVAEKIAGQLNVTLINNSFTTNIDTTKHCITLKSQDGKQQTQHYSQLVLACGATPARPPLFGDAINDVISVNNLRDYAKFRQKILNKKHITLLGAGLIGCEFSNDLAKAGFEIHVISPAKSILDLLLPKQISKLVQTNLENTGINFHLENVATDISHTTNNSYLVTLTNGEQLTTDCILSATGLKPETNLAKSAGIVTNTGIITDQFLQTSATDIYAIGDCAEVQNLNLPYIMPIMHCARALALTLAGKRTAVKYPAMPVTVKTPTCPIAVCTPQKTSSGEWKVDINEAGACALFEETNGNLLGFILTGERTTEKNKLLSKLPMILQ